MAETWRPVVGYEGRYEVSDLGNIRSLMGRFHGPTPRLLRQFNDGYGYMCVNLAGPERKALVRVHRIVARAFLGEPTGVLVRHLNGISTQNNVENLAYGSVADNNRDTVIHGHHAHANRTHCRREHEYSVENTYLHNGHRHCRACGAINAKAAMIRKAAV